MKRKGWVRLLSCVIALLLPISALAQSAAVDLLMQAKKDGKEIVNTITFEPGATLSADKVVADICAVAAIRLNKLPGGYVSLAAVLNSVDVIAAQAKVQPDGVYIQSETLGDKPLYFSLEDLKQTIADSMKANGTSQAGIDQFTQGFNSGIQQVFANSAIVSDDKTALAALTEDEIKQKIIESMGDDSLVKWFSAIEAKAVTTAGEFTVKDSDPADTKTEILVTKADLSALLDVAYVQKQMASQMKAQDSTLTDEQIADEVKQTVEKTKSEIEKSDISIPILIYTKGKTDLVGLEISMTGNFDSNEITYSASTDATQTAAPVTNVVTSKVSMLFQMGAHAIDGGKAYAADMSVSENDQLKVKLNATLTKTDKNAVGSLNVTNGDSVSYLKVDMACDYADAKHVTGKLGATFTGSETPAAISIDFDQTVADAAIDSSLSLSYGESMEMISASPDKAMLGKLKVSTVIQDETGAFDPLKEVTPEASVEFLKLSKADQETFMSSLQTNLYAVLYKLMANLPESASTAIMNGMQNIGGQTQPTANP